MGNVRYVGGGASSSGQMAAMDDSSGVISGSIVFVFHSVYDVKPADVQTAALTEMGEKQISLSLSLSLSPLSARACGCVCVCVSSR